MQIDLRLDFKWEQGKFREWGYVKCLDSGNFTSVLHMSRFIEVYILNIHFTVHKT